MLRILALAPIVLFAACSDDPLNYSAPVGINLKAKSDDTRNGVVTDEKNINTESGNPYGAFIADARDALANHDPTLVDVDSVELYLGANSTGVTMLGEVFTGDVEVVFEMNDTNNSYPVALGTVAATATAGPIALPIVFPADEIPDLDYTKLLNGSFKVIVRGPAAAGFDVKGADADIQTTFTFAAYE